MYGQPTHWLTFDCQHCYKRSYISMEETFDTEDRFCPNCGISSELKPEEDWEDDFLDNYDNEEYD